MLNIMLNCLLCALCALGIVAAAAVIAGIAVGMGWLLLWWVDYRGAWLDGHPEPDKKAGRSHDR